MSKMLEECNCQHHIKKLPIGHLGTHPCCVNCEVCKKNIAYPFYGAHLREHKLQEADKQKTPI